MLLLVALVLAPSYIYKYGYEEEYRQKLPPLYEQTLINYGIISTTSILFALCLTRVRNFFFAKLHVLSPNDFLNLEELPIKIPAEDDAVDVPLLDNISADFNNSAKIRL